MCDASSLEVEREQRRAIRLWEELYEEGGASQSGHTHQCCKIIIIQHWPGLRNLGLVCVCHHGQLEKHCEEVNQYVSWQFAWIIHFELLQGGSRTLSYTLLPHWQATACE